MGADDFSKKGEGIIAQAVSQAQTDILAAAEKLRAEREDFESWTVSQFIESANVKDNVYRAITSGEKWVDVYCTWSLRAIIGVAELNDKIFRHQVNARRVEGAEVEFFNIEVAVMNRLNLEGASKSQLIASVFQAYKAGASDHLEKSILAHFTPTPNFNPYDPSLPQGYTLTAIKDSANFKKRFDYYVKIFSTNLMRVRIHN